MMMSDIAAMSIAPPVLALQSAIVVCQPRSLIPFALRYLQDEKIISPTLVQVYHAVQMIPYLITQPDELKDATCTVFCALQSQSNIFSGERNANAPGNLDVLPNPPNVANANPASIPSSYFREYLDGSQVNEVIQVMDLSSLIQTHAVVDEIIMDRIESLKRVDFNLFYASIRLYLNVYQAVSWLKDDILDYLWTTDSVLRVPVPLTDDFSIELTKWKVTLLKRTATATSNLGNNFPSSSSKANIISTSIGNTNNTNTKQALRQGMSRFSHNYHVHAQETSTTVATLLNVDSSASGHHNNFYSEQDVNQWKRLLLSILEEERSAMVIPVGIVVERFVKSLLQYR